MAGSTHDHDKRTQASCCVDCRRRITQDFREKAQGLVLGTVDYCAWCSAPRSPRAKQLADINARPVTDVYSYCRFALTDRRSA